MHDRTSADMDACLQKSEERACWMSCGVELMDERRGCASARECADVCARKDQETRRKPLGLRDNSGVSVAPGRTRRRGCETNFMKSKLSSWLPLWCCLPSRGSSWTGRAPAYIHGSGRAEGARRRDAGHAGGQGKEQEQEGEQEAERRGLGISLGRPSVAPPGPRHARRLPAAAARRSAGLGRLADSTTTATAPELMSHDAASESTARSSTSSTTRLSARLGTTGIPGATST